MDAIEKNLLLEIAELDRLPVGAYNIRTNGALEARNTTANIDIVSKRTSPASTSTSARSPRTRACTSRSS